MSKVKKLIIILISIFICVGGFFVYEVNREHHYTPQTAEILAGGKDSIRNAFILKDDVLPRFNLAEHLTFVSDVENGTANLPTTKKVFGFYECEIKRVYDDYTPVVTYRTADENIATVDENGVITGVAKGETVITATADNITSDIPVTVYRGVEITEFEQNIVLLKGENKKLLTLEEYDIILSELYSSDQSVATISRDGTVTATGKGKAEIYTYTGDKKISTQVTVKQPVESASMNSLTVYVGENATLKASYRPKDANYGTTFTYKVADSSVAKVSGNTVTGLKAGETTVTAISENGITTQAKLTVKSYPKATPTVKRISRSEYDAYTGEKFCDGSPYAAPFVITFDQPVLAFRINYVDEDVNTSPATVTTGSAIYNNASVPANTPLYFDMYLHGSDVVSTRGFSYVNRDGSRKYYKFFISGRDGSIIITEY